MKPRWTVLAIVTLLAAGALYFFALRPPPPTGPTRKLPFVLPVSPVGIVDRVPEEIRWREVPGAKSYEVEILDASRRPLWKGKSSTCRIPFPIDVMDRFRTREILFYRVRAKAFLGKELVASEPVFFRLGSTTP